MNKAKFQFVDDNRGRWSVAAMCRVLKVTRQGYCQWASRPVPAHDERDFEIGCAMIPLWEELNSCYGAPKMMLELRRRSVRTSRKRVARLMSKHGMAGTCGVGMNKLEIFEHIEAFCNRLRMHSALDFMSPAEFEEKMAKEKEEEVVENAVKAA